MKEFKPGERVKWSSHGREAVGVVEHKITSDTEASGPSPSKSAGSASSLPTLNPLIARKTAAAQLRDRPDAQRGQDLNDVAVLTRLVDADPGESGPATPLRRPSPTRRLAARSRRDAPTLAP